MLKAIEAYLVLRRAAGFALQNDEYLLKSFAGFAAERAETHVQTQTAIDWAALGPTVAQCDARLKAVCRFARYIRMEDVRQVPRPETTSAPARNGARPTSTPRMKSAASGGALQLRPKAGLRPQTYCALIALLAATGLRISEALKLKVADITGDGLLIRETEFGKPGWCRCTAPRQRA